MRDGVAAAHHQTGSTDPGGPQAALDGPHHEVFGAQRYLAGALPFDHHHQAGIHCLDHDLVAQTQSQTKAVETRAEVGTGRRHHGAGHQPRGQDWVTDTLSLGLMGGDPLPPPPRRACDHHVF